MASEYAQPSYEEYLKASAFNRLQYKYGMFITFGAIVCLLVLIGFVYFYANELTTEPLNYAAQKYNAQCTCTNELYKYEFNATQTYITERHLDPNIIWRNPMADIDLEIKP